MKSKPVRVLIVDDSALVRQALSRMLASDPELQVVGTAADAHIAQRKISELKPDVLTLDVEMPGMDGVTFLKLLMRQQPMPVVIISSITQGGSALALEALQAGAVDVLAKPNGSFSVIEDALELAQRIKGAARATVHPARSSMSFTTSMQRTTVNLTAARAVPVQPKPPMASSPTTMLRAAPAASRSLVLIGSSTGGVEALHVILTALPPDLPGILIVQHIPAVFSRTMAERFNQRCKLQVREAADGDIITPGLALIAPGGFHMMVERHFMQYKVRLNDGPPIHHQRPAVDVLFSSAVRAGLAPRSLALLLTGMGADGADGMVQLRQAGAVTCAQDEQSCVVFGMPQEAIRRGGAQHVVPLDQMAKRIVRFAAERAVADSTCQRPAAPSLANLVRQKRTE